MRSRAEGSGSGDAVGKHACALAQSGAPRRGFDARRDHEGQSAFIVDLHLSMPHAKRFQHFFGLPADRVAVVGL